MEYKLMTSMGLGFSAAGVVYLIYRWLSRPSLKKLFGSARSRVREPLKDTFTYWVDETEERLRRSGSLRMKGWQFALVLSLAVGAAITAGIILFKNIVATVFLVVATVLLIDQYIMFKERSIQEHMSSQLAIAVRVFSASFATTPQIEKGIAAVAVNCPDPLGKVFRKADRMLRARITADVVLAEMAKGMNFEYGLMFIQLVKQVRTNTLILPLFQELITRITRKEMLARENRVQVDGERILSLVMVTAPLPSYYMVRMLVPDAHEFLSGTFFGRLVVCLVFLSAITWAVMSRITEKVDA